jgi:3-dehydro-L-gulonate 2-dehydrogenase
MIRVPFTELKQKLFYILLRRGMPDDMAELCARLFTETTCDGVYSHGVNRFPRFLKTIDNGVIKVSARPALLLQQGAIERWNGCSGPGNVNAHFAMERAISLSLEHGIGCVALANTNHWMRGGSYGWQAAEAGAIGICWTNTMPNLPPWGSSHPLLGNNPFALAVPRSTGHVVLDMAMSQFSYGALETYRRRGEQLPVIGGYDRSGSFTTDPLEIEESGRPLPIGFWKGSGLALMLDMIATMLAAGNATFQISNDSLHETGLSQVFISIQVTGISEADKEAIVNRIIESLKSSPEGDQVRYPGERTLETRRFNQIHGIPVDEARWNEIGAL